MPAAGAGRIDFDPVPVDGEHRVEVVLGTDRLAGDDSFRAVAAEGETLSVLLLDNPGGGSVDSLYVQRALEVGSRPSFFVDRQVLRDLRLSDLADRDLVILNDVGALDAGSATALLDYIDGGGGVFLALAELTDPGAHPLLDVEVGDVVDRSAQLGATLGFVDTAHPIFELYRSPESGDLARPRFFRYRALAAGLDQGVLARFDDGAPALVSRTVGDGRVLVWTSSLDTFWTDLPRQPIFVPFLHEMAKSAAGYEASPGWMPATSVLAPGFHVVETPDGAATRAVNLDRREADLTPLDPEELLAAVAWSGGAEIEGEEQVGDPSRIEAAQSAWWYLVVAAVALLLGEAALSNRLSARASWVGAETESPPGTGDAA